MSLLTFLTTTPIPAGPGAPKALPSELSLKKPAGGGNQEKLTVRWVGAGAGGHSDRK